MNTQTSTTAPQPPKTAANPQPPSLTVLPEPQPAQTRASKPKTRNGRIARLPKLERDMVNRMLSDAIPHNKIAEALAQRGFKVTPRNVSNWATRGGYRQWGLDQALLVQTRLHQDTLADFLRDDPTQLPEVGLQIMATRFSQTILRSELDPKQSLPLVAMLCRMSNEMLKLHKFRDLRRTIGHPGYQFEHENKENKKELETLRKIYSGEPVENEQPSRKYTVADLIQALRQGRRDAAAVLDGKSPKPFDPTKLGKPATPATVPRRTRKPKTTTNNPAPTSPATVSAAPVAQASEPAVSPTSSRPTPPLAPTKDPLCAPEPHHAPGASPLSPGERGRGEGNFSGSQNLQPQENPATQIKNQNSKIKNSPESTNPSPVVVELTPLRTPLRFVDNVPQPPPPQYCPRCLNNLEFFRDGGPPQTNCPQCNLQLDNLYGNQIERCPACNNPLPPLLPNGLRPRRTCAVCGCGLATPKTPGPHPPALQTNARFCIYCRTPIPWQSEGVRPGAYCAKCHRHLPAIVYHTFQPISAAPGSEEFT